MKRKIIHLWLFLFGFMGIFSIGSATAGEAILSSDKLIVAVDTNFPAVICYVWKESGAVLYGQSRKISLMKINGENLPVSSVEFRNTDSKATYKVRVGPLELTVEIAVKENVVDFRVTEVKDGRWFFLKTLEIPHHNLLSVRSTQPGAFLTTAWVGTAYYRLHGPDEMIPLTEKAADEAPQSRSYVIVNTSRLAATIYNNVIKDSNRLKYFTADRGEYKECGVWNGPWIYREVEKEITELPFARVVVTPDCNGDGKADWQDGAIAYRSVMTVPHGSDRIKKDVVSQIAMNFASLAQHPFLRVLDNVKKVYLLTDGLGQTVQFKGYQSEGHDSAHPDYGNHFNERAGGLKDLQLVMKRMKDFNAKAGVHINATEFYPEAIYYSDDLLTGRKGWAWLDQSIYADKHYDVVSGKLYHRLDEMKHALPDLSFVYVDVYFGEGWDAYKLAKRIHENGWELYTEFEGVLEREAIWLHRANEWAQNGIHSKVIRFIHNHLRDAWAYHDLLRGARNLGFMGWHSERDIYQFVRNVFTNNLPTKYLQHFPVRRWEEDQVWLEGNVTVRRTGDRVELKQEGRLLASWQIPPQHKEKSDWYSNREKFWGQDNRIFLPWDPESELKIFHWNDAGGTTTWELPQSWQSLQNVYLYQLSDTGRVFLAKVPVNEGKVRLVAEKCTPYVLYPREAPVQPPVVWGEGALVADPGFNSHSFKWWQKLPGSGNVAMINDTLGQSRLEIRGQEAGGVFQKLTGLQPGATYAASVWVEIDGRRSAELGVKDFGGREVKNSINATLALNCSYCTDKMGSRYQRLRVFFTLPENQSSALLYLKAGKGAGSSRVRFDDVRVVKAPPRDYKGHTFFEDFEWTDEGWGPFVFAQFNDTHTHLSEAHPPYTKDVINGRFSLKTRNENQGLVYRSVPGLLKLKPNTRYRLRFEYLQDNPGQYSVVVGSDMEKGSWILEQPLMAGRGTCDVRFTTGAAEDTYIGIFKNDQQPGVMVLDDLALDEEK